MILAIHSVKFVENIRGLVKLATKKHSLSWQTTKRELSQKPELLQKQELTHSAWGSAVQVDGLAGFSGFVAHTEETITQESVPSNSGDVISENKKMNEIIGLNYSRRRCEVHCEHKNNNKVQKIYDSIL